MARLQALRLAGGALCGRCHRRGPQVPASAPQTLNPELVLDVKVILIPPCICISDFSIQNVQQGTER
jgi:hypothetical protein